MDAKAVIGIEADDAAEELRPAKRQRRKGLRSPLTRRILAINIIALVVPVLGLLHLDQYRQSLISSELDGLQVQAHAFALSLGSAAVVTNDIGEDYLAPVAARQIARMLLLNAGVRARVFARSGELLADSFILEGPGGEVKVVELPPLETGLLVELGRTYDEIVAWLPGKTDLPVYKESREQSADDYSEVEVALIGEGAGNVRINQDGYLLLSFAVPVQRYRQVLGALMLSKDGQDVEAAVDARRRDILVIFAVALAVTVLLSFYLAGTIARPIRKLADAADAVRHGKGRAYALPELRKYGDEFGELSEALREMTEALWARLDAIEGFAADVAHEIKNPLTSLRSAVETVARIEDPDQQKRLMSIILDDVGRLDRLISDISDASRLDAELSRAIGEDFDIGELLSTLVEVHEVANLEDDPKAPKFRLNLPEGDRLKAQGLEGRLGQVFRNIISNALTFSPPGGTITLSAARRGANIRITVEDDGPGLPEGKFAAVFDRFYTERPAAEKFGTHSGLGLSISKQVVDAHGGVIRAENRLDSQGEVLGARFIVTIPAD